MFACILIWIGVARLINRNHAARPHIGIQWWNWTKRQKRLDLIVESRKGKFYHSYWLAQLHLWKSFKVYKSLDRLPWKVFWFLIIQQKTMKDKYSGNINRLLLLLFPLKLVREVFLEIYVRAFWEVVGSIRDGAWCGRGDLLPDPPRFRYGSRGEQNFLEWAGIWKGQTQSSQGPQKVVGSWETDYLILWKCET